MTDITQTAPGRPARSDAPDPVAAPAPERAGPMLAADGRPLKRSLARAQRLQKLRALALIAPLLVFVLVTFVAPIADMLFRSVENRIVSETLPETTTALRGWNPDAGEPPGEEVFRGLYLDLSLAVDKRIHTRVGSRLNYEQPGISSLFRRAGRGIGRLGADATADQFRAFDPALAQGAVWAELLDSGTLLAPAEARADLPLTARVWDRWSAHLADGGRNPAEAEAPDHLFTALHHDLTSGESPGDPRLAAAAAAAAGFETVRFREAFADSAARWADPEVWRTVQAYSPVRTSGYFLSAVDMQKTADGVALKPESQRIYLMLFERTLFMSGVIMISCILLGYPIAWLLANLPLRTSNLLLILVLLPFWTSLLVRTSAWKVMLQQQGVVNDTLVWLGLVDDAGRLIMMNNQIGTIVAMTHILLPFMILPLYSVMKTIPPSYLRAAKSLGATNWTAFWRVYFPQSVPGIGAGSILVFILSIGYYITPEIVGGTTGTFISNRIAYHISSSLNWGLAAALGTLLLAAVMILYWAYDRMVGIDNVKLGG